MYKLFVNSMKIYQQHKAAFDFWVYVAVLVLIEG